MSVIRHTSNYCDIKCNQPPAVSQQFEIAAMLIVLAGQRKGSRSTAAWYVRTEERQAAMINKNKNCYGGDEFHDTQGYTNFRFPRVGFQLGEAFFKAMISLCR